MPKDGSRAESDFFQLRDTIRSRFTGAKATPGEAEAEAPARRVPERLVQAIWFERLFRAEGLRTVSGKSLAVGHPGRWNESAGPDFLAAEITIDGEKIKGDVEAHVEASQWRRHGHTRDFEYNNVALHVVLTNDDQRSFDELHNGRMIERFVLEPVLYPDLETIRQTLSPEDYPYDSEAGLGRCHSYCISEDEDLLRRFIAAGGRERMERKIRRLSDQMENGNFSQLLYQSLLTAMGFKGNKALFFLLSKRTPIEELLDHTRDFQGAPRAERMQAALLHVAGLAPRTDDGSTTLDRETLEYLNRVNRHWGELAGYFSDRIIPPTKRWNAGVRPVNLPSRRLAGVARFAERNARGRDLFGPLVEKFRMLIPQQRGARVMRGFLKDVERLFIVDAPDDFWARRYSFTAKPSNKPMSLIGASRARSIVFNSLLPMLILYARRGKDRDLEDFCWEWFERFPKLASNNVERFMRYRLFGADARAKSLLDCEPMQQGLFQIFQSCCNNRERDCSACYFFKDESSGAGESPPGR